MYFNLGGLVEGKHVVMVAGIIASAVVLSNLISSISAPKMTDPIAQRIWAATHGEYTLTGDESAMMIKEATLVDSITQVKKK